MVKMNRHPQNLCPCLVGDVCLDSALNSFPAQVPLAELCEKEGDGHRLPAPVSSLLSHILSHGPATVGIFRRSPNARVTKDLRERLDRDRGCWRDPEVLFSECSVFVTAALLKDFLRSLPDCLLMCQHYRSWVRLARDFEEKKAVDPVKR